MTDSGEVRLEWGAHGVRTLAAVCDVLVIVDVLSFSTAVDVAVSRGAAVLPFGHYGPQAESFARDQAAALAVGRRQVDAEHPYSLSPPTLFGISAGARLVLPSPNGSALTVAAMQANVEVMAGCLRNASAVGAVLRARGGRIGVVPAGERWPDGSLRPAIEDLLGAGSIVSRLEGLRWSPEAALAADSFLGARSQLGELLERCVSGQELIEHGFAQDVRCAAELDISRAAPKLQAGAYVDAAQPALQPTAPAPAPDVGR